MIRPHGGVQKYHAAEFDAFMVSISLPSHKQTKYKREEKKISQDL